MSAAPWEQAKKTHDEMQLLATANARAEALAAECEEWRQNYAALEVAAIAAERGRKAAEANADQLHISLLAATARAEAAGARLAAVPRDALWRLYNDYPYGADFAVTFEEIFEWVKTLPEVQP